MPKGGVINTHFSGALQVCGQVYTQVLHRSWNIPIQAWIQDIPMQMQLLDQVMELGDHMPVQVFNSKPICQPSHCYGSQ